MTETKDLGRKLKYTYVKRMTVNQSGKVGHLPKSRVY